VDILRKKQKVRGQIKDKVDNIMNG